MIACTEMLYCGKTYLWIKGMAAGRRGGGTVQLIWAAASKGLQNGYFKLKTFDFLLITDFKGNSVNVFYFF